FPKKLSFENITDEQIQEVQDKLNNRPRKRLGYLSPIECYTHISPSNALCFSAT
ncbi:MAG: IS30 family transposase, partial [Bacteroidia bacterium]|nr:IS30 family transposase [Bacteroidia bacterium]